MVKPIGVGSWKLIKFKLVGVGKFVAIQWSHQQCQHDDAEKRPSVNLSVRIKGSPGHFCQ